jgi:hypothetical protein
MNISNISIFLLGTTTAGNQTHPPANCMLKHTIATVSESGTSDTSKHPTASEGANPTQRLHDIGKCPHHHCWKSNSSPGKLHAQSTDRSSQEPPPKCKQTARRSRPHQTANRLHDEVGPTNLQTNRKQTARRSRHPSANMLHDEVGTPPLKHVRAPPSSAPRAAVPASH